MNYLEAELTRYHNSSIPACSMHRLELSLSRSSAISGMSESGFTGLKEKHDAANPKDPATLRGYINPITQPS